MLARQGYLQRMTKKLDAWRARFDGRRSEAGRSGATVTAETREQLEASKVAGDVAYAKLAELRAAAAEYFRLRRELDAIWKSIDDSPPEQADVPPLAASARTAR